MAIRELKKLVCRQNERCEMEEYKMLRQTDLNGIFALTFNLL